LRSFPDVIEMHLMKTSSLGTLAVAAALVAALAHAEPAPRMAGGMLVNASGMTLYTFDMDTPGKSACNGPCAALWPPVLVGADAKTGGELSIVTRDDGAKQWAYKGRPVYTYAADKNPGDVTGDNFKSVWHLIK
jgi:predicted lipoprotein with Yx(FWY)xxD motif